MKSISIGCFRFASASNGDKIKVSLFKEKHRVCYISEIVDHRNGALKGN